MEVLKYKVSPRERIYYFLSLIFSCFCYFEAVKVITLADNELAKITVMVLLPYFMFFVVFIVLSHIFSIGHIRGNGIKITSEQFPDIYDIIKKQSASLGLSKVPNVYLINGGGVLNAFATRFCFQNYVILHSAILEAAYAEGLETVEFVIGHELGHIKRCHVNTLKTLLLLPTIFIPFLKFAYSRSCEYTCDNIGHALSPSGAKKGILILAAGKDLYKKIDQDIFVNNFLKTRGFASWLTEVFSTHPFLAKRLRAINSITM